MRFDVVVACDLDWGIGRAGGLPWPRLRADFAHFKAITSTAPEGRRNAIVMGRRTWESKEIAGKPLPRRLNVVMSRSSLVVPDGVTAATSLDEAIADRPDVDATFVIGGAEIYRLALVNEGLRHVYLTRVEGRFNCDVRLPDLDEALVVDPGWASVTHEESGVRFRIERRVRR